MLRAIEAPVVDSIAVSLLMWAEQRTILTKVPSDQQHVGRLVYMFLEFADYIDFEIARSFALSPAFPLAYALTPVLNGARSTSFLIAPALELARLRMREHALLFEITLDLAHPTCYPLSIFAWSLTNAIP